VIYKPKTIGDHILSLLQKGSLGTGKLLKKVQEMRPGTTKQALYQILRKLKTDEVVVMRSKQVSLSHIWINKMAEYFKDAQRAYTAHETPSEDFLGLADGEKISYTFKSPAHTDMFWGHAFGILAEVTKNDPLYIYNPHEWFILAREESEKILFNELREKKKQIYMLIGHNDALDVSSKKEFENEFTQYYASEKKLFPKENYYVNMFGEYVIEAWIDENVALQIDLFYKETNVFDENAEKKIKSIVEQKGKNKLSISRNKRKAEKLKNLFKKYFHIKK
jgi:hypothetical protein